MIHGALNIDQKDEPCVELCQGTTYIGILRALKDEVSRGT